MIKKIIKEIGSYFNLMSDKEDERQVIEQVSAGVVFRGTNLWILMFAILIASLGLNVNSTAVIIGAMLVSPLMGPIIGLGLSVGIGDYNLLRRALKNYGVAALISVLTATVYFAISPISGAGTELLARKSPSLYDVLIAFCGGAAGVLALTTKSKGQVIPGVAIATALMPPLCTAGYGLATLQWDYFFGALYLFFINTVFIALSTFLGVKLLHFHRVQSPSPEGARYGNRLIAIVLIITLLPASFMTINIVKHEMTSRNVQKFVEHELSQPGTQILSSMTQGDTINIVAVGRTINDEELDEARRHLSNYGLKDYTLSVIQSTDPESIEHMTAQLTSTITATNNENRSLVQQLASLQQQLDSYTRYDTLSAQITNEATQLFPRVGTVHLGKLDNGVIALVECLPDERSPLDADRIRTWLRTRLQDKELQVIFI